jgi:hypothetical protein
MNDSENYRVDSIKTIFIISAALAVDILQALLDFALIGVFVNWIISIFALFLFYTWFSLLGISFTRKQGANLTMIGGLLIEMIPIIDLLPGWTTACALTIRRSRREDQGKKPALNQSIGQKTLLGARAATAAKPELKTSPARADSGVKARAESANQNTSELLSEEKNKSAEKETASPEPADQEQLQARDNSKPSKSEPRPVGNDASSPSRRSEAEETEERATYEDIVMTSEPEDIDPYREAA